MAKRVVVPIYATKKLSSKLPSIPLAATIAIHFYHPDPKADFAAVTDDVCKSLHVPIIQSKDAKVAVGLTSRGKGVALLGFVC